jgi:hypothetical protein
VWLLTTDVSQERIASTVRVERISELQLLVTAKVVLSSLILFNLMNAAMVSRN